MYIERLHINFIVCVRAHTHTRTHTYILLVQKESCTVGRVYLKTNIEMNNSIEILDSPLRLDVREISTRMLEAFLRVLQLETYIRNTR